MFGRKRAQLRKFCWNQILSCSQFELDVFNSIWLVIEFEEAKLLWLVWVLHLEVTQPSSNYAVSLKLFIWLKSTAKPVSCIQAIGLSGQQAHLLSLSISFSSWSRLTTRVSVAVCSFFGGFPVFGLELDAACCTACFFSGPVNGVLKMLPKNTTYCRVVNRLLNVTLVGAVHKLGCRLFLMRVS